MMLGILASAIRRGGEPAPEPGELWTPLNMATVPQIYLDAQDSVVTDAAGFAAAISNLGAMGVDGDFSQASAANRPAILDVGLNDKRVLSFDGVNDLLQGGTSAMKNLLRNVGTGWVFHVTKKRTTDVGDTSRLVFFCDSGGSGGSRLSVYAGRSAAGSANRPSIQSKRLDGDTIVTAEAPANSGAYIMRLDLVKYSAGVVELFVDGQLTASAALASAGNTSDTASNRDASIGALVGGAIPGDIALASIVVSREMPSTGDIDRLFGWAAHKYGLTANLPANHPYKATVPTV